MGNAVTIRTSAPGAKEAAGQIKDLHSAFTNLAGGSAKAALAGAAVSAGFGLMTKGAMQAEKAQGEFMTATGRSREEAKEFVKGLNAITGSAKTVGTSFDELAATGTEVAQQFGITGDKARDLTEDIAGFARVTGQDASDAAGQLEDMLSAFGLSADDAAGFMDRLVASSQKYGTEAGPEALAVLQGMSPALVAMGMDIDDGIELLNAFEVAGLDAAGAQKGLQKAIADLKPGQTLDDLIAQIGAIEDPTLRAQKAIEIFGTRAGAGLARVIQPGMTSLDEFGVSAEEAAGTVDRAAEDMMTTSDKIKAAMEKLGAGLRDVGQEFGPLVTGAGAATSAMAPLTGALWKNVAATKAAEGGWVGLTKSLAPAGVALGVITGGIIAAGAATDGMEADAATATAAIAGMTDVTLEQAAALDEAADKLDAARQSTQLFGLVDMDLTRSQDALVAQLRETAEAARNEYAGAMNQAALATHLATERAENLMAPLGDVGTELGERLPHQVAAAGDSFTGLGEKLHRTLTDMADDAHDDGIDIVDNLSDALRDNKDTVKDAMQDLVYAMNHPLAQAKELARIEGALTSSNLSEGLASGNDYIRTAAQQARDILIGQWESLSGRAYDEGHDAQVQYNRGMSNAPRPRGQAPRWPNDPGHDPGHAGPGGMALGGPVKPNTMYEVNEGGVPEMLQSGGRSYLLMGAKPGQVEPIRSSGVVPSPGMPAHVVPQAPAVQPGPGMPARIDVHVNLSVRDFAAHQKHYAVVQAGGPAFR